MERDCWKSKHIGKCFKPFWCKRRESATTKKNSFSRQGGENLTHVKVEAHGHLGDFSREYIIVEGKEIKGLTQIFTEFAVYALKGKENVLKEVLGELVAIEAIKTF